MTEAWRVRVDGTLDRWEMSLESRAYRIFRPREIFYVVERVNSIGWCILSSHRTYSEAYDARALLVDDEQTRVMTRTEWRRRTLEIMGSRQPWIALAILQSDLQKTKAELADLRAIENTGVLRLYADPQAKD